MAGTLLSFLNSSNENDSDYSNLSGSELMSSPGLLRDLTTYYSARGQSFATTDEMLDQWYTDNRWKDSNFVSAGRDMLEYQNAGDSDRALMARLSLAWQNAPERGSLMDKVVDYGAATIFDPVNFIPYAGAASKAGRVATAARAAGATRQAATRAALRSGAARGALLEGTVGAGLGGGFEALQQSRQIQQGLRDDYDGGQIATAAAIEGGLSGAIGAPLGALASRAPAERALQWQVGTPMGERLNSRLTELSQIENEARIAAADDTLPEVDRVDARELLIEVEKERADVQRAVNAAVRMDTELESAARQIETARANGQDTTALQADYDRRYGEFQELIASSDYERVNRLSSQEIQANRAAEAEAAKAPSQPEAQQPAARAADMPTEAADTPAETAPTAAPTQAADAPTTTPEAEAPAAQEATPQPAEAAAPEADTATPAPLDVPNTKPVKFSMSEAQQRSFDKGWGKNGSTHANKAKKAGNEPLTQADLEKIVASVENGVNKDGRITRNGMRAIREYMASREGRTFNQPVRRADGASFTDPNVAVQRNAADDAARAEVPVNEKAEVSDYADYIFEDILREVGPANANRMLKRLSGLSDEMQPDVYQAVRRRIADWRENAIPVIQKAVSDQEVARLRTEFLSRQGVEDMKYTPNRVAGNTEKTSKFLERDAVAGRVFREYTDPKTGEKRTSSKVSRWLKRGLDVGDGYTVNEGASIFRRVNETSAAAEALANQDLSQGKLRAVYPFSARSGQPVIGLKGGGRGRGGPAEEGQVVYGVMTPSTKSGRNIFKVYATEEMALKASGLKRSEDIKIDPNVHKPISEPEELEKLLDQAEDQFAKDGDYDKLDEATQTAKAQARAGGLSVDPPSAPRVVDGRGNDAVVDIPEAPLTRGDKVLVLLPKTLEQKPRVVSFGYQNAQVERGATLADILGKGDVRNFSIGYVPREVNGRKVTSATDRDVIKVNFEPLDENNRIDGGSTKVPGNKKSDAEIPAAPIDFLEEADLIEVDIQRLAATEGGQSVAQRLFIGARLAGTTSMPSKLEDFMSSRVSLANLYETLQVLERQEFQVNLPGSDVEVPFGRRVDAIKAYLEVLAKEAPNGFRRPTTDIENSIAALHKVSGRLNKTSFSNIERMFRAIVPEKEAPIFKTVKEYNGMADVSGASAFYQAMRPDFEKLVPGRTFGADMNTIFMNPRGLDRDGTKTGVSTSFVVMHELGHWAYENLLPYDLKLDFWRSVSKYYDENGRFDGGFVSERVKGTMLDARSPLVELDGKLAGVSNAKKSPQELWANQFALWAHHKYNATGSMAPRGVDGSFFDKAAAIIKKLWMHITNRHIVDPELESIFDKMISRKDEARRVQFTFPKEPNTRLGQTLRIRYDQVNRGIRDLEAAIEGFPDMHDPEKMALAARQIADAFNGMAMSQRERAMVARRNGMNAGDAERAENYSGIFRAITGHRTLRKYAKDIYEAIGSTSETVSQKGDDFELGGASFNSEMPKALVDIYNGGLRKYAYGKLEEMNEAYMKVEYGDIPEVRLSDDVINLRADRNISGETLQKKESFEQNAKRATNIQRRNMKAAFNQIMKSQAKSNYKEFGGKVVTGTKGNDVNKYSMTEALAEYRRQIDAEGNPSDFGKKLARRVYTIVNTEVEVPPLTPEEQAIYNTWQSKTRVKGGGNKGRANAVQKHEVVLGLAVSADGEAIKGLGATPEQAYNIIRNLVKERNASRSSRKAARDSDAVDKAVIVEQYQDLGTSFENGIPANATITMREYLRGITHRSPDVEYASRTITARLARLGAQALPQSVTSASYPTYRKMVRSVAANVSRSDDVTQAVKFVGEALYGSQAVTHASRNVMSKAAAVLGDTPENLFSDILAEVSDITSPKQRFKVTKEIMDGEDADAFADFIDELENEVSEALAYTMNGLVAKKGARERFYPITSMGDMIGNGRVSAGSPRTRYGDTVPAEYAVDHANEIIEDFTQAGLASVREFTGGSVVPHFTMGVSDGPLGSGTYVRELPSNTLLSKRDEMLSDLSDEARGKAADLIDTLTTVRAKINMARINGDASNDYIDRLYAMDDVVSEQLEGLGVNLDTNVRPVFIRDNAPALFSDRMTVRDPVVQTIISHLRSSSGSMNQANAVAAIRGLYDANQMVSAISDIVGGERKFRRMMRDAGFSSITIGDDKLMLNTKNVRAVRSDAFENATPIIGENTKVGGINGRIVQSISNNVDPIRVFNQAAAELEEAGVPAKTLEAMISVARGRGMPSEAAQEIRKSGIFNPFRTNSKIMARANIKYLANFFEPTDGSGGHFERTNANMGKFLMPFTKMLKELPDSGNALTRYWRAGPQMMAETAMGSLGIAPNRRQSQPASHLRILDALRDSSKAGSLTPAERKVYDHTRSYLDEAIGRLRSVGAIVGEIKDDYFPQIWRKDLIEMDQEEFTRRLTKYFLAEREGAGNAEQARKSAERVVRRLLDEDGVLSNPAQNFKRSGDAAGTSSDHLDYSRLINLQDFPQFANFDSPDSLAPFLENDLLVAMTKYSDNLEHRIDFTATFGAGAHGYHDYMSILTQPMNARAVIGELLSSNKVISTGWVRSGKAEHGVKEQVFDNNYFYAPIKDKYSAGQKADELIQMAQSGSTAAEIEANIMSLLGDQLANNADAAMMRQNFQRRAAAIANALSDTKGMTQIPSNDNLRHAQGFMNTAVRKPVDGIHGTFSGRNVSKWLRGVNAVTLLGFTTLTSLGDLVLPLIRTGDFASYTKALRKFASDPVYRDMIRNIGAATENAVHQRLSVAHGVDSTQFMTGFFNTTLLTPWTDMMRDVAASVSYEHLKAQHKILKNRPNTRAGRIARRILMEEGLAEFVNDQSLDMDLVLATRGSGSEHPLVNKLSASAIKLTNQMIFTPNPNDIPLWAQTPLGALAFQLKSYPLMMTRMVNQVAGEAFRGDTVAERGANFLKAFAGQSDNRLGPLAALLVAGPAMGSVAVGVKDVVQGRGGEDNREFQLRERRLSETLTEAFKENEDVDMLLGWYFDGMVALGGLGLMGELLYDVASQTDNGAYGTQRVAETLGGPTVGLYNDAMTVAQGVRSWWDDKETNGERRAAVREIVGRVPVLGGVSWAREGITDVVAGQRGGGSGPSGGGSFGGGFGGSFGSGF